MARKQRIQTPGLIRHVMARGNGRMQIFLDDVDYRKFEYLLGDILEEFQIKCWNYCVMPNHYHATLCPTLPNLSDALRRLNGVYAQWWNWRHSRVGHVFQGRFKDQIVQEQTYLLALCRYVAMNPVRANLVEQPDKWPWSSYAGLVGLRPAAAFVDIDLTLRHFGEGDTRILRTRFADFVTMNTDQGTDARIRSNERILGDRSFKNALRTPVNVNVESGIVSAEFEGTAVAADSISRS